MGLIFIQALKIITHNNDCIAIEYYFYTKHRNF